MARRWSLQAGRTFYLDGKPAISIHRIVDDNGNAALSPTSVDKLTHVIANCLTHGKSKDRFGNLRCRTGRNGKIQCLTAKSRRRKARR